MPTLDRSLKRADRRGDRGGLTRSAAPPTLKSAGIVIANDAEGGL
jgi:hypothetical protein